MSTSFAELLARVRTGDGRAAEELVRRYEPVIRVTIRARLQDSRLRRVVDTTDICQSVMATFFARAAFGEFDLDAPDQLVGLLVTMAKNKVISQGRHELREKRDVRRLDLDGGRRLDNLAGDAEPGQIVADRELLASIHAAFTADEREIAERRGSGQSWQEIADALGGTAEARRKQFSRALARVLRDLGLDEGDEDV